MCVCLHTTIITKCTCNVIFWFTDLEKRVEELETMQYLFLLQVTGDGKECTSVNEETSIKLSFPFRGTPPSFLPLEQLSCQLTDPLNEQVPCSITPTQPGVCTVMYTPTIRGPHQLRIKIKNTDIQGSPFRVSVLPEADRGVVQHTITGVERPQSVAVNKSGDVVVCYDWGKHISVFNGKGEKRLSFLSGGRYFHVAFTFNDNHILAISHRQITKYTMEGKCLISVECTNNGFRDPSGIAVHPSGKVIVAGSCIQVLNSDLTHSHSFGIRSHGVVPAHVACDSDGVVYVAGNHCIRSFSIDGHCISKYSYDFIADTIISGVCIDSSNTLYVSNTLIDTVEGIVLQKCVSVHSNSVKFIKCLGLDKQVSLAGIAVDNTTGVLYVCDDKNNCVIVY